MLLFLKHKYTNKKHENKFVAERDPVYSKMDTSKYIQCRLQIFYNAFIKHDTEAVLNFKLST